MFGIFSFKFCIIKVNLHSSHGGQNFSSKSYVHLVLKERDKVRTGGPEGLKEVNTLVQG